MKLNILEELIKKFSKFPGLGPRSARRVIFHLLKNKEESFQEIINALEKVRAEIVKCIICGNLDTKETCSICLDNNRKKNIICVVEDVSDLWALERSNVFNGTYHILGGVLSAIDGVNPNNLNISSLNTRIENLNEVEIILAISATLDGQTTAHYLSKLLHKKVNKLTRLAHGVPIGSELDYLDEGTITQALKGRTLFE